MEFPNGDIGSIGDHWVSLRPKISHESLGSATTATQSLRATAWLRCFGGEVGHFPSVFD